MPQLTAVYSRSQGPTGQGGSSDWARKWMAPAERSWKPESPRYQPQESSWSLKKLLHLRLNLKGWYSFALVVAVWSVCQVEAPLYPSAGVCWKLVLVCLVWMVLGGCFHTLKSNMQPGQKQGTTPPRTEEEIMSENRNIQFSWAPRPRSPGPTVPLALTLADGLLLSVLQEPLPDPPVPHIKSLLNRLESVFHVLQKADIGSEETLEMDYDPKVTDKVKLIQTYLQKRMNSLCTLIHVQQNFEASVKDMLEGLDGLWAQLEELHTGVTLTRQESQDHGDLALALTDAETLFAVLGRFRNRLQRCQTHLKDSTQLLQELTWSHTHMSNRVRSRGESVWPELLLQSNIEQFDKVQENFLSMEQQTSTFQAHLEGLRSTQACSGLVSSQTPNVVSPEQQSSLKASSIDKERQTLLSLCERSALQFSSTIGRLRRSGRRK